MLETHMWSLSVQGPAEMLPTTEGDIQVDVFSCLQTCRLFSPRVLLYLPHTLLWPPSATQGRVSRAQEAPFHLNINICGHWNQWWRVPLPLLAALHK